MEVSTRDWLVAMLMIQRLNQTCNAFEEMFGKLCVSLSQAGLGAEQIQKLNDEWDRSMKTHVEEISNQEAFQYLTENGVGKEMTTRTLEDVFDAVRSQAEQRFEIELLSTGRDDAAPED